MKEKGFFLVKWTVYVTRTQDLPPICKANKTEHRSIQNINSQVQSGAVDDWNWHRPQPTFRLRAIRTTNPIYIKYFNGSCDGSKHCKKCPLTNCGGYDWVGRSPTNRSLRTLPSLFTYSPVITSLPFLTGLLIYNPWHKVFQGHNLWLQTSQFFFLRIAYIACIRK